MIIYSNSAKSLETIKESIDFWLDESFPFVGNTLLITGSMEPELKLKHTTKFTAPSPQSTDIDAFHPQILLATASCIGAGLDSSDAYAVVRMGFPASINDLAQEMGRYGRRPHNDASSPADTFALTLSLNNFAHVIE